MSSAEPDRPVLIGIPVYGRLELLQRAVRAMDRHTPVEVELVLIDDCGPQRLTESDAGRLADLRTRLATDQSPDEPGFRGQCQRALRAGRRVGRDPAEQRRRGAAGLVRRVCGPPSPASRGRPAPVRWPTTAPCSACPSWPGWPIRPGRWPAVRKALPVAAEMPVAVGHCTWFSRHGAGRGRAVRPGIRPRLRRRGGLEHAGRPGRLACTWPRCTASCCTPAGPVSASPAGCSRWPAGTNCCCCGAIRRAGGSCGGSPADPGSALAQAKLRHRPDPGCGMIARAGQPVTRTSSARIPTRSSEDIHG